MNSLLSDLRYAARRLRHSPGFTAIVILTLALGIGANSAIFSVVNTVLLRPLPYADPANLVTIFHSYPTIKLEAPVSAPGFKEYRDRGHEFSHVAVSQGWNANLTGIGEPERVRGSRVSAQFFAALGISPAKGRVPLPEEDVIGKEHVVVLSDGMWKRLFASDAGIVGKQISLNNESYDVIGVMPAGFVDPWNRDVEMWAPVALNPDLFVIGNYTNEFLTLTARLKPGHTVETAQKDLNLLADQLRKDNPGRFDSWGLKVKSMMEVRTGSIRTALLVLLGAVGFVLLIACANVANLFLARAAARQKEVAIRTALGARPRALVQQLLVESGLLAVVGGLFGLLVAWGSVRALVAVNPGNIPRIDEMGIDPSVVGFTLLVSLVTGLLFGLVPAIQASRGNLQMSLKDSSRGASSDKSSQMVRRALVVAEVALALTLLTGGGLFLKSFARLSSVSPGFDSKNVLTFAVGLPRAKYQNDTLRRVFYQNAIDKLAEIPGVKAVGAASVIPFGGDWSTGTFSVEGYTPASQESNPWGDQRIVSPGFVDAMRIPLIKGRFLDAHDIDGSMLVAVVDEEFVKRFYKKGEDPIGRRFWFGSDTPNDSTRYISIVGVVGHAKHEGLDADARVQVYRSLNQAGNLGSMVITMRTANDPKTYVTQARKAIHDVDSDVPLSRIRSMDELVEGSMGQRKLSTVLLGAFAGIALLLASLGIYGVMAYTVAQRTRELGVRMALGASRGSVLRLVLRQGLQVAVVGVLIGLGGSVGLSRLVTTQLYDVKPTDPSTFAMVTAVLTLVAVAASLIPALRATRVDPIVALRQE